MELLIFYFTIAIGVSFVCSIMESVLLTISIPTISVLGKTKPKTAQLLKAYKADTGNSISAILILNTIAHTVGAAGVGSQAELVFGSGAGVVATVSIILTFFILFLSEIIPKTIGIIFYKELATSTAYSIKAAISITYPVLILTKYVTDKLQKGRGKASLTKEELVHSTLMSESDGVLNETESDVIENILSLKDKKIKNITTPRSMLFALDESTLLKDAIVFDEVFRFSRIPVFSGSIDNIVGVVLAKTIFKEAFADGEKPIADIYMDIYRLHENIPISKTLDIFIKRKEHIILVEDSYGQTVGIVSLEDCMESILGVEIIDELDEYDSLQARAKEIMKSKRRKGITH